MRRTAEDAAETRASVVTAASRELRRNGIQKTGVSALMATLGLTHGGFYNHFGSKERLVAEAIAEAANTMSDQMKEVALRSPESDSFNTLINWYLSAAHRENIAEGCPMVSLGAEAARSGKRARQSMTLGFLAMANVIADSLTELSPAAARKKSVFVLSAMIGAMTMARLVDDADLSAAILREARKHLTRAGRPEVI